RPEPRGSGARSPRDARSVWPAAPTRSRQETIGPLGPKTPLEDAMSEKKRVLCVVGPTACGKTKMGVLLAKQYGGEVVSVDSMQIYRGMTIGSAAPTAEEMEGVPHHMVAVADPAESWSVARFTREADRRVQDILARGKLPVLVGGTGLYLDALIDGRTFAAGQSGGAVRRELEERLAAEGVEPLLSELRPAGPGAAARLP